MKSMVQSSPDHATTQKNTRTQGCERFICCLSMLSYLIRYGGVGIAGPSPDPFMRQIRIVELDNDV